MIYIDHNEQYDGKITVVTLGGYLDSDTAPDFDDYIDELIRKNRKAIVCNASGLEYVSSQGIGSMVYAHRKIADARGMLVLCSLKNEIRALYKMLGFDTVLNIEDTFDAALGKAARNLDIGMVASESPDKDGGGDIQVQIIDEHDESPPERNLTGEGAMGEKKGPVSGFFETPLIVECASCGGLIRVPRDGSYICPECHTEFSVDSDQTVIF